MKKIGIGLLILMAVVGLAACNNDNKKETAEKEKVGQSDSKKETEKTDDASQPSTDEKKVTEKNKTKEEKTEDMFSSLRSEVKDTMSAEKVKTIFTDTEAKAIKREDTIVSINGFELDEVTDFHSDFEIPFKANTDKGGVVLAEFTVENTGKEPVYFTPSIILTFTGATKSYSSTKSLLSDESKDFSSMVTSEKFKINAGEKVTGNAAYAIDLAGLEKIEKEGLITAEVPAAFSKEDSFKREDMIGEDELVNLAMNEKGKDKNTSESKLYKDKVTLENWGEKTLVQENTALNKKEKIGKTEVTLEGYQFTEFKPNEDKASRFSSFENGVVLLTAKFKLDNQGDYDISLTSSSSTLLVNNGSQKTLSEGMLVKSPALGKLEQGKSGEWVQVFVLDKEQYDKIWKDKSFVLETRFRDYDTSASIEKGKTATFEWKK